MIVTPFYQGSVRQPQLKLLMDMLYFICELVTRHIHPLLLSRPRPTI